MSLLHVRLPGQDGLYLSQAGPENGGQVSLGLVEGDDVADALRPGHEHDEAVETEGQPAVGGTAVFARVEQKAKRFLRLLRARCRAGRTRPAVNLILIDHHVLPVNSVPTAGVAASARLKTCETN